MDLGGGSGICEEGGSVAGEGRRKGGACEGGEEVGDAGVCIAACKPRVSPRPGAHPSADPPTSWSPSPNRESISPGAFESACLPAFVLACQLPCESLRRIGRCVTVHPQQVLEPPTATVSVCPTERLVSDETSFSSLVGLTE